MEADKLQVGQKYIHKNGVCMYTGSSKMSIEDGTEAYYAMFIFKTTSDKLMIPHSSLHLVEPAEADEVLTDMTYTPSDKYDEDDDMELEEYPF